MKRQIPAFRDLPNRTFASESPDLYSVIRKVRWFSCSGRNRRDTDWSSRKKRQGCWLMPWLISVTGQQDKVCPQKILMSWSSSSHDNWILYSPAVESKLCGFFHLGRRIKMSEEMNKEKEQFTRMLENSLWTIQKHGSGTMKRQTGGRSDVLTSNASVRTETACQWADAPETPEKQIVFLPRYRTNLLPLWNLRTLYFGLPGNKLWITRR